jgi:low affinity Fe/Cu permease
VAVRESVRHPAHRGEPERRGRFDRMAQAASHFASSPAFFAACAGVVLVWAAGVAVGASTLFLTIWAGVMMALTLLLVALLKNAELRADHALQRKLDAIAMALLEQRRGVDDRGEDELEHAIGMHDEV